MSDLPVNAPGALLYLGDCHATRGDGELCRVALQHPTVTTLQVDLIKKWTFKMAAAGERQVFQDDRLKPADGGCRPYSPIAN
jgi:acetamidase/formamidase